MIELIFEFGSEIILVRISGKKVEFGSTSFGAKLADISGLRFDKAGVIKEFPDLKDNEEWRFEAIKRFKEKIKSLNNESEVSDYIINELKGCGYKPKFKQRAGFRREVLNV